MKKAHVAVSLVTAIALGVVAGWSLAAKGVEDDFESYLLTAQLGRIALCAGVLGIPDEEHARKTHMVLERCLESSLTEASRLLESGVTIEEAIPNLREGARRAVVYAGSETVSPKLLLKAERFQELLDRMP